MDTNSAQPRSSSDTGTAERELALLFTDVVDSTQINERVGIEKSHRLWAEHDRAARELIRVWHGREVGRSDGFLVQFDRCEYALGFALGYHQALASLEVPFTARVGFHWGPAILRPNDPADVAAGATPFEIDGVALPTAARVMSAALGRQTLLSGAAFGALPASALQGLSHCNHGHWRLKGLDEPVELHELGHADAPLMPPADSAKAYRVLRRTGQWQAVAELPNNLGSESDAFVGRDAALHALARAFDEGSRLVTLLGTGGVGKTRLALRYARGWMGSFPGGVWFCDLSASRTLDGIAQAVAHALDLPLGRSDPVQQLATALAGRGQCLLVLDNFEQVARHAEACLGLWLRALPEARFLVTSREVLGLPGERLQGVAPMSPPEAQQLFLERMRAAGLGGELPPDDAAALPTLVEMLDCLPLAVELAASRARVMPPADQLKRIGERFWLLSGRGSRLDRQATLRATLDWSWDLLDPAEQLALAQLSVLEGGFTLHAVEAVVDLSGCRPVPWVTDVLQSLVEKSLVQRLHARRFALLRSVQDYAAERLPALDPQALARHWRYFASLSEGEAIAERCADLDNLAAACRNATLAQTQSADEREDIDEYAVGALVNASAALRLVGPFRAVLDLARPLSQRADLAARHRARVARVLGGSYTMLGQPEAAARECREGIELARQTQQPGLQAQLLGLQAELDIQQGHFGSAEAALNQAQALADHAGDDVVRLMVANLSGNLALARSDWPQAEREFTQALALALLRGDRRRQGGLHGSLGTLAMLQGRAQQARPHLVQALQLAQEVGDRQWAGNAHSNLGLLLQELGELDAARRELDAALLLARAIGHPRLEATALCNLGLLMRAMAQGEKALECFEQSVTVSRRLGATRLEAQLLGYLGEQLAAQRQGPRALECLGRAEQLLAPTGDVQALLLLRCQQTLALARLGELAQAVAALEQAESLVSAQVLPEGSELDKALNEARRSAFAVRDDGVDRNAVGAGVR